MEQERVFSGSSSSSNPDARGRLNPAHLFPCKVKKGFTTAPPSPALPEGVLHVALSDKVLGVVKVTRGTSRDVTEDLPHAPDGTQAWQAVYPEGSINPGGDTPRGGFGCYLSGPGENLAFEDAEEVVFSYAVLFEPDFDFK